MCYILRPTLTSVQFSRPLTVVWSPHGHRHLHGSIHPNWHCHGHNKPAEQHLPYLPIDLRCCFPRTARCEYGLRHLWIYHFDPRAQILVRPEIRSLYEDPAKDSLQHSALRYRGFVIDSNWCPQLDVRKHSWNMHSRRDEWLHLPHCPCPLQWKYSLGRCWSKALFRSRCSIPPPRLGIPRWRSSSNCHIPCCEKKQQIKTSISAEGQPPSAVREPELDSTSYGPQLLGLGTGLLALQLSN